MPRGRNKSPLPGWLSNEPSATQRGPKGSACGPLREVLLQGRPSGHMGLQVSPDKSACLSQHETQAGVQEVNVDSSVKMISCGKEVGRG